MIVHDAFAAHRALSCSHMDASPVRQRNNEAVPDDLGRIACDVRGKRIVCARLHGYERFALSIDPKPDLSLQERRIGILDAQGERDGGSNYHCAEWDAVVCLA